MRLFIFAFLVLLCTEWATASLIVNGGFETPFSTSGVLPTTYGLWEFDPAYSVTAMDGITPLEGERMLRFEATDPLYRYQHEQSNVWQLVDVSGFRSQILSGTAVASASAWFNRVAGDAQTDTRFGLELWAFAGDPSDFPNKINQSPPDKLASAGRGLFSDSDPSTWEKVALELTLPKDTTFLALHIAALENVFNNAYPEFDGHYADAVSLSITAIPEPTTLLIWLGLTGIGLLAAHRRRKRNV
jgi:MYXO-CTERM domain-containing protein